MRWKNARQSQNVEDNRGKRGTGKVALGGGLGTIIMALVAIFIFKQPPQQVMQDVMSKRAASSGGQSGPYVPSSPQEEENAKLVGAVLGLTEDVWDQAYPRLAQQYQKYNAAERYVHPKLNLFSGVTASACGRADASVGPFYCPGDNEVYIDLAFFDELKRKYKAPGDFAQAYVIAHEVGHHIQNLLGISAKVQSQRNRPDYNQLSVRLELHADYLAGVWANRAERQFQILERGDIEEGIRAASAVGDDTIQKRAQGHVVPDSFTHGSAEQRIRWFTLGLKSGDPIAHSPFDGAYENL